jgi:hypothetical protein
MRKNMVGKVPHDVATRMGLPNAEDYTFHSYRTSATSAASGEMTAEQMQVFFGWKNSSMCHEYISTSRPAVMHAANLLGSFDLGDVAVEEEDKLPVEMVQEEEDLSGLMLGSRDHLPALFYFSQYSASHTAHHCKYSIIAGS